MTDLKEKNRLTREQKFIEKANKLYNGKYDYSQVHYIDLKTKIKIGCPTHGFVEIRPEAHLKNSGCPICNKENRTKMFAMYKEQGKGPWSKNAREKAAKTNMELFGAKTWAESDVGRKTAAENCASEEVRKLMSERAKSQEARANYEKTSLKNHGAKHWTQSKTGNKKLKAICNTKEERKNRSLRMKSKEVQTKIQNTSLERYGVPYYWQSDEGKKRLKKLLNSEEVI